MLAVDDTACFLDNCRIVTEKYELCHANPELRCV